MFVINTLTFTKSDITYTLRKGLLELGNGRFSKKVIYELAGTTNSLHGSTRDDLRRLLMLKLEIPFGIASKVLEALDESNADESNADDTTPHRKDCGVERLPGGRIPTTRPTS